MIGARELQFGRVQDSDSPQYKHFVRQHHYSKACPPGKYWFAAWHENKLVGVMVFRKPSLPKTAKAYDVQLELSRLVMLDEAGKNSESRFIGFALRWIGKNDDAKAIISFADPRAGHDGVIYRASNWEYLGREKGHGTRRIIIDGEELHSKTAYDRYGFSGSALVGMLAPKNVQILVCPPKNVFRYKIRKTVKVKAPKPGLFPGLGQLF